MSTYQGLADSSEFTISYWVNRDSCTAGILFGRADSIGSGSFACYLTDSCTIGFSGVFVNQSFVNVVKSLEANLDTGWNHILIEKDQSTLRLQINGVTKDTEPVLGSLTSPQPLGFVVGAPMSLIPNGPPVAGAYAALDDIGLWSRKLSSSEKKQSPKCSNVWLCEQTHLQLVNGSVRYSGNFLHCQRYDGKIKCSRRPRSSSRRFSGVLGE